MLRRTLTALLLIPPVVYLIGWSPKWLFILAVVVAVVLALREYLALCRATGFSAMAGVGYVGAVSLCLPYALPETVDGLVVVPMLGGVFLLLIPTLALRHGVELKDYLGAVAVTLFGIFYIGVGLSCLVAIRFSPLSFDSGQAPLRGSYQLPPGAQEILLLFMVIWAGDICAYLVGRSIGRTPFFARISPKKTWEGAVGGFLGSLLVAWAFGHWFWSGADLRTVILVGAWIAVAGQAGDLVESAIKRGANQKDSGTLLPGHGGFLDRIDSLLFGAPALWLALLAFGNLS